MSTAPRINTVSVEDYLAGELISPVKHEYLDGVVHAMSGGRNVHNRIAGNIYGTLWGRLHGRRCRPCNSDTKVRIRLPNEVRFYYPDAFIVCHLNPPGNSFEDNPVVIFEVLSRRTRRIDQGEKRHAYLSIPSLSVYALLEQDSPAAVLYRRTGPAFVREDYQGVGAVIPLPEVSIDLPLADVYYGVALTPESDDAAEP